MAIEPDGVGKRYRVTISGESFYFIPTIGTDGWIHFMAKTADENKLDNSAVRLAVDETCKALGMAVNELLGNVGRAK